MTDDQARRIDGLLAAYGEMRATLERLDERSAGQGDDIEALRQMYRDAMVRTEKMLGVIAATCEKNTDAVGKTVEKQGERLDALTRAQRWTPTQWAAILGPTLTALIGAAAIVLTKGSP